MTFVQYLLILLAGLAVVFLACLSPERFFRVIGVVAGNVAMGFALLFAVNALSGITQLTLPINGLTLAVSGVLGAPGIAAVTALAAI